MGNSLELFVNDSDVDLLSEAGLTYSQAKIFLFVVRTGPASVSEISRISKIDRSYVSKTLNALEKLGLVTKLINRPTLYKSVGVQSAITLLIKKRKEDHENLMTGLEEIAQKYADVENCKLDRSKEYFEILPSNFRVFNEKWIKCITQSRKSIKVITGSIREPSVGPLLEGYTKIMGKKICIRWLFEVNKEQKQEFYLKIKPIKHLLDYPNVEARFSYDSLKPWGCISDNETCIICLDNKTRIRSSRTLWTNNKQILLNFNNHFEEIWDKAFPLSPMINTII
jgi:sugar-specific transcriptional regulator TrmB